MVSSGKVTSDASSLSSILSTYQSTVSELASSWKGASYDNLSSKASEFVSEFGDTIQKEMSAFANACSLYEEYKEAKSSLESARSGYNQAVASGDKSSASSYNSKISEYSAKIESLKKEINSYLEQASSSKLQASAITASTSTTDATTDSSTTTQSTDSAVGKSSNQVVQNAMDWAIGIANNNKYGYNMKTGRWGNPNYDCSSLVISAYEQAGIKVKEAGASYTGNMKNAFIKCGFEWIPGDPKKTGLKLQPGDVLLKVNSHTEMYVGNGKNVGAHSNFDGKTGDSSGREINVQSSNHAWDGVLRLKQS